MELSKENKQLYINKEALTTFALAQEGILGPIDKLMNQEEAKVANEDGYYKKYPFPISFILAPNGKRNQENILNAKKGDTLEFVVDKKVVGKICVEGQHPINKYNRIKNIFGIYDDNDEKANKLLSTFGDNAVSGEFEVEFDQVKKDKKKVEEAIKRLNAVNITGIMMGTKAFNRAHERLIRTALEQSDLLIIFLKQPNNDKQIPYSLRKKTLQYFIDNYLPNHRILLIPIENTYLFYGRNNLILQCIVAANFGCTKFVIGHNHQGIGMYYDSNQLHFSLDKYKKEMPLKVSIVSEFVYCNECKTLVSTSTCPHGTHHHIKYHGKSLKKLLLAGILPPALFIRRDISSIILSDLFPKRFKNVQAIYDNLFPNDGLLEPRTDKDFYEELMILYQTTSMV